MNPSETTPIRLALVDDEHLIVRLLEQFFNEQPSLEVVLTAHSGEEFIESLENLAVLPQVLLLDLRMKALNGVETTTILRERFPSIRVIIMSSHYETTFIGYLLKTGVSAFLPKEIMPKELIQIIQSVHETGYYFLPEQVATIRTQVSPKAPKPKLTEQEQITSREKEILTLICQQCTAQEIAERLFITKRTVEGHKNNLLSKLGVKNTAGLVIYAIQKQIVDLQTLGW